MNAKEMENLNLSNNPFFKYMTDYQMIGKCKKCGNRVVFTIKDFKTERENKFLCGNCFIKD